MNIYDKLFDKWEKEENVPMIFGREPISFSEVKQLSELNKEEAEKIINYNSNLSLIKKNMLKILSASYRERMQNREMQNENLFQKKLVPSKSYMGSGGFIDIALFFFTILSSALSILMTMLFVIKSHL